MKTKITFLGLILLMVTGFSIAQSKVILIGIDGMSIEGFQTARLTNIYSILQQGALSLKTRGVMPTVSAPNWSAITMGAGPEQTGIVKNGWNVKNEVIPPSVSDKEGYFPSIFTLIRQQQPKAKTALFYDWKELADLYNLKNISKVEFFESYEKTFEKFVPFVLEERPDFSFVYIGYPDETAHEFGHMSLEYIAALEAVDTQIGTLISRMKLNGLLDLYTIMVVSDHGFIGKDHGNVTLAEIEIPWIISGPGIIKNRLISQPNDLINTSSTIAYILEVKQPEEWIGRPVLGAFVGTDQSKVNTQIFVPKPIPTVKSGIYLDKQELKFSSTLDGATIRYTLTGKRPDSKSPVYKTPIPLTKSTTVIAVASLGGSESSETVVNFTKIDGIKSVIFNLPVSDKYPGMGPYSLVDGVMGAADHRDRSWLGFQGGNLDVVIELSAERRIKKLVLDCYSKEDNWIFLPVNVEFYKSSDGKDFTSVAQGKDKSAALKGDGVHQFSAEFPEVKAKYIRVIGTNVGVCPPGHPGKGEKAWLFVDEIVIR